MDAFEQIQENTIAGSAFSARLGSSAVAFIPDPDHRVILGWPLTLSRQGQFCFPVHLNEIHDEKSFS